MTNIDRAAEVLGRRIEPLAEGDPRIGDPQRLAQGLADAGLLTPAPTIIRTVEELEALDPDTLLSSTGGGDQGGLARSAGYVRWAYHGEYDDDWPIPAVVVATGAEVRAARKALEEA